MSESILEKALLEAEQLEETMKSNAKEILSSTMKKEIHELVNFLCHILRRRHENPDSRIFAQPQKTHPPIGMYAGVRFSACPMASNTGAARIFSPTPRSYGWMDFDAVQKINFAIQDGLWILVPRKIHLFGAPVRSCLGKSPGFMG